MLSLEERVAIDLSLIYFLDYLVCPLLVVLNLVNMFMSVLTITSLAHEGVLFAIDF